MDAQQVAITGDTAYTNPRWNYPEYPRETAIEIRVHGVGGEPPSGMTRDPHPRLVGGDQLGGFWRARNPVVRPQRGDRPAVVREVLSWGGQTSGSVIHAFWVLLLPFALFNVAGRMHVVPRSDADSLNRGRARAHRAICRVLGLTLTLTAATMMCGLAFGLVAACDEACLARPRGLNVLLQPLRTGSLSDYPDARLGVLALLPVGVLLGLWLAGRYKTGELESYGAEEDRGDPTVEAVTLVDQGFWHNDWPTSRLRAVHLSAGYAWIAVSLALVQGNADAWTAASAAAAAGVVLAALVLVGLPSVMHRKSIMWWTVVTGLLRLVGVGSLALLAGRPILAAAGWRESPLTWVAGVILLGTWLAVIIQDGLGRKVLRPRGQPTRYPKVTVWRELLLFPAVALLATPLGAPSGDRLVSEAAGFRALDHLQLEALVQSQEGPTPAVLPYLPYVPLIMLQVVLLLLLVAMAVSRTPPARDGEFHLDRQGVPANLGAPCAALLAIFLLTATGTSTHLLVQRWLVVDSAVPGPPPMLYDMTSATVGLIFPFALLVAGAGYLVFRRRLDQPTDEQVFEDLNGHLVQVDPEPPRPTLADADAKWLEGQRSAWFTQSLVRNGGRMLLATVAIGTSVVVIDFFLRVIRRSSVIDFLPQGILDLLPPITIGVVLGAVWLIRRALRDQSVRRNVASAFDVLTFFPRVTHPFAPPCYGEKIVPMLARRIRRLLECSVPPSGDRNYRVVLTGHSQGSVVALAAIALVPPPQRERVALVTYGSPIGPLYRRMFRGPVAPAVAATPGRVRLWHNVFGMTEPFAWPVWNSSVRRNDHSSREAAAGWPVNLDVARPDDVWEPSEELGAVADRVITDPRPLREGFTSIWSLRAGHSTYHDSRELDDHLLAIADSMAARGGSAASATPPGRPARSGNGPWFWRWSRGSRDR